MQRAAVDIGNEDLGQRARLPGGRSSSPWLRCAMREPVWLYSIKGMTSQRLVNMPKVHASPVAPTEPNTGREQRRRNISRP